MKPTVSCNWSSSAATDPGVVRDNNEDAFLALPEVGFWLVADGMGGHAHGELASAAVVSAFEGLKPADTLAEFVDEVEERLIAADHKIHELAASRAESVIGSTVAALLCRDGFAVCLWAGDSRIYRLKNDRLERLTQDHAYVEELVEMGLIKAAEARDHPQANIITRAVGVGRGLHLDAEIYPIGEADVFLICSDGLTRELAESEITDVLRRRDGEPSRRLVGLAMARGARDNVTVIVVRATQDV